MSTTHIDKQLDSLPELGHIKKYCNEHNKQCIFTSDTSKKCKLTRQEDYQNNNKNWNKSTICGGCNGPSTNGSKCKDCKQQYDKNYRDSWQGLIKQLVKVAIT